MTPERCGFTLDVVTRLTWNDSICPEDSTDVDYAGEGRYEVRKCARHHLGPPTSLFKGSEDY